MDKMRKRLQWRCRRGMGELDFLLERFMRSHFDLLTENEIRGFQRLLDSPDALLLEYFLGQTKPLDPELAHVVDKIRRAT
jgi:antitoxin CptB